MSLVQWSYLGGLGHCAVAVVRLDRSGCLLGWLGDPGTLWRRSAHAPVCPRVSKWLTDRNLEGCIRFYDPTSISKRRWGGVENSSPQKIENHENMNFH